MATVTPATLDDLYQVDGKAELVAGRIVHIMPSGILHARISGRIFSALLRYSEQSGVGEAFGDALGYALPTTLSSGRQSFCPDVSYLRDVDNSQSERFVDGPPTLAVEVRSESDYGRAAEREMTAKRADYFEAGTLVVWDVDPRERTVAVYRAGEQSPKIYGAGQEAEAEPALPGWRLKVDELFA